MPNHYVNFTVSKILNLSFMICNIRNMYLSPFICILIDNAP